MTDEEFLRCFLEGRIPHAEWTHRAHVRAAFLICRSEPAFEDALRTMSEGILLLNEAHAKGGVFLENLTRAWMRTIEERARRGFPRETFESFIERHPDLLDKRSVRPLS